MEPAKLTLIGRSSSHFTRVTRIFAAELGVAYDFQVVRALLSIDPADYGGNPALELPALRTPRGVWFGALNICRELYRQSSRRLRVIRPEDLDQPLLANAQELAVQAMSTEVTFQPLTWCRGSMLKRIFAALFGASATPQWIEGGLYASPREDGTYGVLKILKVDDRGVHVRSYSNVFPKLPASVDESSLYLAGIDRKPGEELGMGHMPVSTESFASWGATFIQQSSVSPEELEGYRIWLEAEGGYF